MRKVGYVVSLVWSSGPSKRLNSLEGKRVFSWIEVVVQNVQMKTLKVPKLLDQCVRRYWSKPVGRPRIGQSSNLSWNCSATVLYIHLLWHHKGQVFFITSTMRKVWPVCAGGVNRGLNMLFSRLAWLYILHTDILVVYVDTLEARMKNNLIMSNKWPLLHIISMV